MKRSFKVATVFTGVAALGAIAAPAANAAVVGPGTKATPNITGKSCGGFVSNYKGLILAYTAGHAPACFSGTGTTGVGGDPAFQSYCAGSAVGYLYIGGKARAFTSNVHQLGGQHVSKVDITRYTGGKTRCED